MDIVGPLPRSIKDYKYILVVCDYATRYPEAIPVKKFTADAGAEELITLLLGMEYPRKFLLTKAPILHHNYYRYCTNYWE